VWPGGSGGARGSWLLASPFRPAPRLHLQGLSAEQMSQLSNLDKVSILAEALPYMQKFAGKTIVVKYGGAAMKDPTLKVQSRAECMLTLTAARSAHATQQQAAAP